MRATPGFSAEWLADELSKVEFNGDDGVGLIGVFALMMPEPIWERLQHALKAAGLQDHSKSSWAGILLIQSKRVPEGCITVLAPTAATFEGVTTLFEKTLKLPIGGIYAHEEGRAKVIRVP